MVDNRHRRCRRGRRYCHVRQRGHMLSLQLLVFCVEVMGIHALVAPLVVLGVFTPINFFCSKLALTGQWWRQD
jgi:hypothetical protein